MFNVDPQALAQVRNLANGGDHMAALLVSLIDSVGIGLKAPCRAADSVTDLTAPGATLDGVTMVVGDRFLNIRNAGSGGHISNGVYIWLGATATAVRAADAITAAQLKDGSLIPILEGTLHKGQYYGVTTDNPFIVGTDAIDMAPIGVAGSATSGSNTDVAIIAGYTMYVPPAAEGTAGASTLVTDVAVTAVALTLAAQPKIPCKLNIYKTDGDSSAAFTLTIIGKGPAGEAITDIITALAVDGTHTYISTKAFATITSATVSALSGNTGADKVAIGQATAVGLPIPSGTASVTVFKEGFGATSAAAPTSETVGTVDTTARTVVPTTAADGTKALHFWWSYTHVHAQT